MAAPCAPAILLQLQPGTAEASRLRSHTFALSRVGLIAGVMSQTLQGHLGPEADYCNEGSLLGTWIVNLHCFGEADSAQWGQSTLSPEAATWEEG